MRNIAPPLWKSFSWNFAGSSVYMLCQWGMLVVLAKLGSPETVGQFTLGLAVTAPVVLFANLELRQVQATDATGQYAFGDYLGLRLITVSLALLAIAGIAFVAGYRLETALIVLAVGLAKAFEAVSDVIYGLLQRHERMDRVSKSMMIKGPLSLAALGLGFYITGSVFWGAVSLAAAWALVLIFYDVPSGALVLGSARQRAGGPTIPRPRLEVARLARLAHLALPLGIVAALVSLDVNAPRYLTDYYLGERQLGIFAAISYVMVAGRRLVPVALGQSSSPRLARYYAEGDHRAFRVLLLKLVAACAAIGVAGILVSAVAGRGILTLLYTAEYARYADAFVCIMVAAAISYAASILSFGITAARRFRVQVPLLLGVVGTTSVACLILVPRLGVLGASLAVTLGMVFQLIASALLVLYLIRVANARTKTHA